MTQEKIKTIFIMSFLGSIFALFGCNNERSKVEEKPDSVEFTIAKRITINELEGQLTLLQKGKTEFDFIGITSNGIDCIYFVKEGNNFQLEFEAMGADQLPYIDSLKEYAGTNAIKYVETTYGNKPQYNSNEPAPVIRLLINANLADASSIGQDIEFNMFGNNSSTVYDVVP